MRRLSNQGRSIEVLRGPVFQGPVFQGLGRRLAVCGLAAVATGFLPIASTPVSIAAAVETQKQDAENLVPKVGKQAPDFIMTGIDGKEFKLSDRTKKDKNIVLMFSRASW